MWSSVLSRPVRNLAGRHTQSQIKARRNALVAATALAQRRREWEEVEEFLAHQQEGHGWQIVPPGDLTAML